MSGEQRGVAAGVVRREARREAARALIAAGGRLAVAGACMAPRVPGNATVAVRASPAGALRIGDVVVVAQGERLMLHRLLWKAGTGAGLRLLTGGDRMRRPDPPAPAEAVLGRLAAIDLPAGTCRYRPQPAERIRALASGSFWALAIPFLGRRAVPVYAR